ncbi:type II toxin-antitoxin system ParD family antitoxin [Sphingomonas sp. QA11]|uniref:ribbon-helix-helix domain-containing protein n=1 Tax=Sphingomonas sp. QA11 TaxID=2950605 RepID=UPI00234B9622|nr:type II toxin-antitoxin system ParD family antitoxin [Sphingomonas sp. QA11]WCM27438.1 type II toxin-antitoxin system ParD family antitoxin [Sphingomonas sp. QA11]
MAQMKIDLTDEELAAATARVATGDFASVEDYIQELIQRDQNRAEKLARLQAAIEIGRASGMGTRSLQEIYDDNRRRRDAA